jgi:ATP-dependent DNA helicase RecG
MVRSASGKQEQLSRFRRRGPRIASSRKAQMDLEPQTPVRRRLAYDELADGPACRWLWCARHCASCLDYPVESRKAACARPMLDALPFSLTGSQTTAVDEILADMAGKDRMLRLLAGRCRLRQNRCGDACHGRCRRSRRPGGADGPDRDPRPPALRNDQRKWPKRPVSRLPCSQPAPRARNAHELLERIAGGQARIIVGTHALFQDTVVYNNLTLAVVDEQHRFGVHQRLRLTAKGTAPHMLVMTATPIPRTLVLAAFGDMDVSKLTENPQAGNRSPPSPFPTNALAILSSVCEVLCATARRPTGSVRWSRIRTKSN